MAPMSFFGFPEDVQLNILSFVSPAELTAFACTSRSSAALCSIAGGPAWLAMCDRRWGSKTHLQSWAKGGEKFPFYRLYRVLDRWEHLVGFWRRIGPAAGAAPGGAPRIVFFEWGHSCIIGSRVSPSPDHPGSYAVRKVPFLLLALSAHGEPVCFLHPGAPRVDSHEDFLQLASESSSRSDFADADLIPVTVSFVGSNHLVVEEDRSFYSDTRGEDPGASEEVAGIESTSPPDQVMSEIYRYFANRTIVGGDKASRRQRRKERERLGRRRRLEAEHFVKIVDSHPTPSRPLQGLWKGICENMVLEFFLVAHDDVGGLTCRRVGDGGEKFSGFAPIFWTSNTTFLEPPFSKEEQDLYDSRGHIRPVASGSSSMEREVVSRILCINSSYDLVIPDLYGSFGDSWNVEGRIWEYEDGTFGFGFLRDSFIVDLKHTALNGCLLDSVEYF